MNGVLNSKVDMRKNLLIIVGVLFVLFFTVGGHFINKYYNEYVRSHPQMYCYETFRGPDEPVSVLIIEDIDLKEHYLKYYRELESGIEPTLANEIPLKGMPQSSPIYVMGYTEDGLLADVACYYEGGGRLMAYYTRGWVYSKTLHKEPFKPR